MKTLKAAWPWEPEYLRLMLAIPVVGIACTATLYFEFGAMALWFLISIPIGLVFWGIYRHVGGQVTQLARQYRQEPGDVEVGLLVIGRWQTPGVVVRRDKELILHGIVGEPYTLPIDELQVFREGNMLPGKYLWGKRAFILEPHNGTRLGFGIAEPVGIRWSRHFKKSPRFKS